METAGNRGLQHFLIFKAFFPACSIESIVLIFTNFVKKCWVFILSLIVFYYKKSCFGTLLLHMQSLGTRKVVEEGGDRVCATGGFCFPPSPLSLLKRAFSEI